jgi:PIF1-like helicase
LIVDEVSTIDTCVITLLNYRLKQVMDNHDLPFGGILVVFVGDFNQLGPVQKTFIPNSMMTWATRRYHKDIAVKTSTLQCTPHSLPSLTRTISSSPHKPPAKKSLSHIGRNFSSITTKKDSLSKELHKKIAKFSGVHWLQLASQFQKIPPQRVAAFQGPSTQQVCL